MGNRPRIVRRAGRRRNLEMRRPRRRTNQPVGQNGPEIVAPELVPLEHVLPAGIPNADEPPRRGRGRPRRNPAPIPAVNNDNDATQNVTLEPIARRQRGRPRRNPPAIPLNDVAAPQNVVPEQAYAETDNRPRRGRGRPRRNPPVVSVSDDGVPPIVRPELPAPAPEHQIRRIRGQTGRNPSHLIPIDNVVAPQNAVNEQESRDRDPNTICNVCLINSKDRIFIPCGHTFCCDCANRRENNCFICRQPIRHVYNAFI